MFWSKKLISLNICDLTKFLECVQARRVVVGKIWVEALQEPSQIYVVIRPECSEAERERSGARSVAK